MLQLDIMVESMSVAFFIEPVAEAHGTFGERSLKLHLHHLRSPRHHQVDKLIDGQVYVTYVMAALHQKPSPGRHEDAPPSPAL